MFGGIGDQRVRVRATVRVHAFEVHGLGRVRQVEDSDALETRGAAGGRVAPAVLAADQFAVRLRRVDRLEEQEAALVLPERDVVLGAAAQDVGAQPVGAGPRDVEDAEAVVVPRDDDVAPEREVGMRSGRPLGEAPVDLHPAAHVGSARPREEQDCCTCEDEEISGPRHHVRVDVRDFHYAVLGSNRNFATVLLSGTRVG